MPIGSLTTAMRLTGGLQPLVDSLRQIQQKQQLQDYYNRMQSSLKNIQGQIGNIGVPSLPLQQIPNSNNNVLSPRQSRPIVSTTNRPGPQNALSAGNSLPIGNTEASNNALSSNAPIPIQPQNRSNVQSNFDNVQTLENYDQARELANNWTAEQLIAALRTPGANPNAVNALGSTLQSDTQKYMPTPPTFQNVPQGSMSVERDKYGNILGTIVNPKEWDKERTVTETNADGSPKIYKEAGKQYLKEITTDPTGKQSATFKPVPNASKISINGGSASSNEPYKGFSNDLSKGVSGLNEIKTLRSQIYNPQNIYAEADSIKETPKLISVSSPTGVKAMTVPEATAYKNQLVAKYQVPLLKAIKQLKAYDGLQAIYDYAKKYKVTKLDALKQFEAKNPQITEAQRQALENYFELSDQ